RNQTLKVASTTIAPDTTIRTLGASSAKIQEGLVPGSISMHTSRIALWILWMPSVSVRHPEMTALRSVTGKPV
ncbi:MAG TPA: hypothetical protein VNO32_61980, partial [Candidatus Acidoferrum sp.]|nr:hypothetical protein [Candidatus Acidoferrum sp.]